MTQKLWQPANRSQKIQQLKQQCESTIEKCKKRCELVKHLTSSRARNIFKTNQELITTNRAFLKRLNNLENNSQNTTNSPSVTNR